MKILIINGFRTSGKDTFIDILSEISTIPVYRRSWVDKIKEIATEEYNWDGSKILLSRRFLSELCDERSDDCFYDVVNKFVAIGDEDFIYCIIARRPMDIERLKRLFSLAYKDAVHTVCIRRESVEGLEQSNTADQEILDYDYNFHIDNSGSIWEFIENIKIFYKEVLS